MSEIIEIKNLLRELAKKENNQELIEAWIEIWNQGYIDNFPKICIESLQKELDVYDFAEYILDKNETIEDRYSCYNRLIIHLNRGGTLENYEEAINIQKKLYKKLLLESIDKIGYINCIEQENSDERLYIFTNLYFPKSLGHSPSTIVEILNNELKKYFNQVIIVIANPYHFPYPLAPLEHRLFNSTCTDIDNNCVYKYKDITFIRFGGYVSEALYLEFVNHQKFTSKDKFLLVGHSNIHFDLIKSDKKINIPLSEKAREFNSASYQIWNDKIGDFKNIFNKRFKIILASDLTRKTNLEIITKNKNMNDNINIAIVGNRLDIELDIEFFKYLEKAIKIIPNLKFKIIGEQPKLDLISKKLLKNIEFISFISDLENYFIENIDFYLNPKRVGGGHSSMMAIKANIPVITLAYGDVYSTLEKKYFINSFDEIADFIKNYIEDKDFKIKIDNMNKEILIDSSKVFEDMIRTIVKI
ncbi:glycosyltransferase family protein [Aliarcobacter cryaerophilus]|uniref:hypothetical protein n=1 Tax=Aliarcobacter cryaerophilus TaxID=28198 RepID=UPI0021B656FB|nr:hypothetical protein [Aliarcobacter cryaerophilus]MCT7496876.1 hypothetical protein [Aliarcobacter cryaerophilus]